MQDRIALLQHQVLVDDGDADGRFSDNGAKPALTLVQGNLRSLALTDFRAHLFVDFEKVLSPIGKVPLQFFAFQGKILYYELELRQDEKSHRNGKQAY